MGISAPGLSNSEWDDWEENGEQRALDTSDTDETDEETLAVFVDSGFVSILRWLAGSIFCGASTGWIGWGGGGAGALPFFFVKRFWTAGQCGSLSTVESLQMNQKKENLP